VDGNVLRVVARICNEDTPIDTPAYKKSVQARLSKIYPEQAGEFTQSLMELGATLCGPNRPPACEACPCKAFCRGALAGTAEQFPVKTAKKARRVEEKTVFILSCDGSYALEKRPAKGLLAGLWQFPNVSGKMEAADAVAELDKLGIRAKDIKRQAEKKHIFTHVEWDMYGVYMEVAEEIPAFTWMTEKEIQQQAGLPTAFRQFL
jgi:A/G-specific adenine glycosylase